MHIPDGILPLPVSLGGFAFSAGIVAVCLYRINQRPDPRRDIPKAAMLTAAFFAASLVHVPVPPFSVHLTLGGLMGVVLGWFAFPAIVVGLFFQAVMFGHGGLTALGVNALIQGGPALVAFALFRFLAGGGHAQGMRTVAAAFLGGAGAAALSVLMLASVVLGNIPAHLDAETERRAVEIFALVHLPVMIVEGMIVAFLVGFLRRTSPQLLRGA